MGCAVQLLGSGAHDARSEALGSVCTDRFCAELLNEPALGSPISGPSPFPSSWCVKANRVPLAQPHHEPDTHPWSLGHTNTATQAAPSLPHTSPRAVMEASPPLEAPTSCFLGGAGSWLVLAFGCFFCGGW